MSYAHLCETCDGRASWEVFRHGDAVVSWACHDHLAHVSLRLQKARETELRVTMNTHHPSIPDSPVRSM